jgi:hypothetical protein
VLVVAPTKLLDRQDLSTAFNDRLLHLIAPILEDRVGVTGQVSLSLDHLRIPLGGPRDQLIKRLDMAGTLQLNKVSTKMGGPLGQAVVKLIGDVYGQGAPADTDRTVEDAEVRFRVRDGRMYHEGLRLGIPDLSPHLQIHSSGSAGLDGSLDLMLEVPRPGTARGKGKGPVVCRVTGSLAEPRLNIKDGFLVIPSADLGKPLLDVEGVDLAVSVEGGKDGRVLTVAPAKLLDKQDLSTAFNNQLLHLVAPAVQNLVDVKGQVSLSVDKLRIPLGVHPDQLVKRLEMSGRLQLHQVSTKVQTPHLQAVFKLAADFYGKAPPETLHVVEGADVRFEVRDGRVYQEGLQFGLPDISPQLVIKSSGSVGVDKSLDLTIETPPPDTAKGKRKGPVVCHVTGYLNKPQLTVKGAYLIVPSPDDGKPLLDVEGVDLTINVDGEKNARVLTVAPTKLLDKVDVSAALNDRLLRLVVPTAEDVVDVTGQVSLVVDKLRLPLGVPVDQLIKSLEMSGKLQLHQVSTKVDTPLLQATVKVLADRFGKKPSDVVRVAKDTEVRFQVRNGRVHHEGLELGFPDISPKLLVRSSGSVGLDKSLDIVLELPRVLLNPELRPGVAEDKVRFRITGTVNKPVVVEIKQ